MSVVAYPSLYRQSPLPGVYASTNRAAPTQSRTRKLNGSLQDTQGSFESVTEMLSETPSSAVARQTRSNHTSPNTTCAVRFSSLKLNARSLCTRHKREDVGSYAGFEIYEEQQRAEQRRKARAETMITTCSGETLIDIDEEFPTYSKDLKTESDGQKSPNNADVKLSPVRSRLSLSPVKKLGKRNARIEISETADESNLRKSAKAEKKKERWSRWFGGLGPDWAEDHEGDDCGWYCSKHRYSGCQATLEWWCVAGMYM